MLYTKSLDSVIPYICTLCTYTHMSPWSILFIPPPVILRLNNIPLYVYWYKYIEKEITSFLFIHLSMHTLIISISYLWLSKCYCLYELVISFPLVIYPEKELLGHLKVLFFISIRRSIMSTVMATPSYPLNKSV
jgi:hypothetical protein